MIIKKDTESQKILTFLLIICCIIVFSIMAFGVHLHNKISKERDEEIDKERITYIDKQIKFSIKNHVEISDLLNPYQVIITWELPEKSTFSNHIFRLYSEIPDSFSNRSNFNFYWRDDNEYAKLHYFDLNAGNLDSTFNTFNKSGKTIFKFNTKEEMINAEKFLKDKNHWISMNTTKKNSVSDNKQNILNDAKEINKE